MIASSQRLTFRLLSEILIPAGDDMVTGLFVVISSILTGISPNFREAYCLLITMAECAQESTMPIASNNTSGRHDRAPGKIQQRILHLGMMLLMDLLELFLGQVRIDLGGRYVHVAQQFLHRPEVGAVL